MIEITLDEYIDILQTSFEQQDARYQQQLSKITESMIANNMKWNERYSELKPDAKPTYRNFDEYNNRVK